MSKESGILKLMNIRAEEAKAVFMLMAFSFFTGLTLSFYFTASNALFLKHFNPSMIPVSFIGSGVLIYLAWLGFSRIDRKLPFSRQVTTKLLFVFITVLILSAGVYWLNNSWLIFLTYTWVRIVVYITLVTFWSIAGKLFNIRQGKRIFGLIGIGEVVSIMIGYFSIPLLLRFLKAPDLLFLSSGTLLLCYLMAMLIISAFRQQLSESKNIISNRNDNPEVDKTSYWKLVRKPYFAFISVMALLPIFGYLFVDFLFLSQTKVEFAANPEAIAGFFGVFLGFVAVIELIMKLFSGRWLNKFGIRPSLLSLPVVLLSSVFLAAVFGSVYGTVSLFFAFIALARLFERSVRAAAYEPAFQLLYQPVPVSQRLIFQNQIEGIPKASGTVITGVIILVFSAIGTFNLVFYSWFFILVLALWIWMALKTYESYRQVLKSKLAELDTPHDVFSAEGQLSQALGATSVEMLTESYLFIQQTDAVIADNSLKKYFSGKSQEGRLAVLNLVKEHSLLSWKPILLNIEQEDNLYQKAQEVMLSLKQAEELPASQLNLMGRSADSTVRIKAARLLASSARYQAIHDLQQLAADPLAEVRRAAVVASGNLKRIELWPAILDQLSDPVVAASAIQSARKLGEAVLPELARRFDKAANDKGLRMSIIRVLEGIPGNKASRMLAEKLSLPDSDLRRQVIQSLNSRDYRASFTEFSLLKSLIEEAIAHILWVLAAMQDLEQVNDSTELKMALLTEMDEQKELVFMTLSLMYESKTIQHIREHIESKDGNAKVYALEIGEMTISNELKELFFPVFEDLPVQDRLNKFQFRFPQERLSVLDRLTDILNKPYTQSGRYTKACAMMLLGKIEDQQEMVDNLLATNMIHPDNLLAEPAAWALFKKNEPLFDDRVKRLLKFNPKAARRITSFIEGRLSKKNLMVWEQIDVLKSTDLFGTVAENELAALLLRFPALKVGRTEEMLSVKDSKSLAISTGIFSVLIPLDVLQAMVMQIPAIAVKGLTMTVPQQKNV